MSEEQSTSTQRSMPTVEPNTSASPPAVAVPWQGDDQPPISGLLLGGMTHDDEEEQEARASKGNDRKARTEKKKKDSVAAPSAASNQGNPPSIEQILQKEIQLALAQAVTSKDLKKLVPIIKRLHEENQENRDNDYQSVRTYLEKMTKEARLMFVESRTVLEEKLAPLQHASIRDLQATQALGVAFDDAKKDLATRLTAQGRHYNQSLQASLDKLQQAMLTRLKESDNVTSASLRQVFVEYGMAGKLAALSGDVKKNQEMLTDVIKLLQRPLCSSLYKVFRANPMYLMGGTVLLVGAFATGPIPPFFGISKRFHCMFHYYFQGTCLPNQRMCAYDLCWDSIQDTVWDCITQASHDEL